MATLCSIILTLAVGLCAILALPLSDEEPSSKPRGSIAVTVVLNKTDSNHIKRFIRSTSGSERGNANDYTDHLLENVRKYIVDGGYDPLQLGHSGECKWIHLDGLKTIKRTGDATLTDDVDKIILEAHFGFEDLHGTCYLERKEWIFKITGLARARMREISMFAKISMTTDEQNVKSELLDFQVADWGTMETKLDGVNWVGQIVAFFTNIFPSVMRNALKKNLPRILRGSISNLLRSFEFDLLSI